MNFVRRMTAGLGSVMRSDRTTRSESASTISALPSITRRSARRIGTMVSGSNDAFRAKQPTTTQDLLSMLACARKLAHLKSRRALRALQPRAPTLNEVDGSKKNSESLLPDDEIGR